MDRPVDLRQQGHPAVERDRLQDRGDGLAGTRGYEDVLGWGCAIVPEPVGQRLAEERQAGRVSIRGATVPDRASERLTRRFRHTQEWLPDVQGDRVWSALGHQSVDFMER
jgi:hypothetical protein